MSREDFRITIADVPGKEESVCEVYYKERGWVEISYNDAVHMDIVFFNKKEGDYWEFPYEEAMEIIQEAKERLAKYQRTPEDQAEYDAMKKEQENWKPTPEETAEYERKMEEQWEKYYG